MTISEQIDRIERDCSKPDWDSYSADPVTEAVVALARELATAFVGWEVGPTFDGAIQFSHNDERDTVTVIST